MMSHRRGETLNSDVALQEYKCRYYKELTHGLVKVQFSEKIFMCPYCLQSREYGYEDICRHASRIAKESRSAGLKEKAKHMALLEFLKRSIKPSGSTSKKGTDHRMGLATLFEEVSKRSEEIIMNFHTDLELLQEKANKKVKMIINENGQSKKPDDKMLKLVDDQKREIGKLEQQMMELKKKLNAKKLLELEIYQMKEAMQVKQDGDVTMEEEEEEEKGRNSKLVLRLEDILEDKSQRISEIESEISRTDSVMKKEKMLIEKNQKMIEDIHREHKMMQHANEQLKNTRNQYDKSKLYLDELEKQLKEREAVNQIEQKKLDNEKNQNNANDTMLILADNHKKEMEELDHKIMELQKKVDEKQRLELEMKQTKARMEELKHKNDQHLEAKKKSESIQEDLKEKEEDLESLKDLHQALTLNIKLFNDELQDARQELISGLEEDPVIAFNARIGLKRMGELDSEPFMAACKRRRLSEDDSVKILSLWEQHLRDPNWHPFKEEMVDEEDERIVRLKGECDADEYEAEAVVRALKEVKEYNPGGRHPVSEIWHNWEDRKATLKESIIFILTRWKRNKKKQSAAF